MGFHTDVPVTMFSVISRLLHLFSCHYCVQTLTWNSVSAIAVNLMNNFPIKLKIKKEMLLFKVDILSFRYFLRYIIL